MSVRSDSAVCRDCGLVALAANMVRLDDEGEYVYACVGCAAKAPRHEHAGGAK